MTFSEVGYRAAQLERDIVGLICADGGIRFDLLGADEAREIIDGLGALWREVKALRDSDDVDSIDTACRLIYLARRVMHFVLDAEHAHARELEKKAKTKRTREATRSRQAMIFRKLGRIAVHTKEMRDKKPYLLAELEAPKIGMSPATMRRLIERHFLEWEDPDAPFIPPA